MAAPFSFVLAIFRPYFNEPGADPQSHPKPLKLNPIATKAYAENGLRLSHCCYPVYFQQFNRQKGPVFAAKIVTAVQLARLRVFEPSRRPVKDRCNGYIGRRRLGRRFRPKPEYPLESDAHCYGSQGALTLGAERSRDMAEARWPLPSLGWQKRALDYGVKFTGGAVHGGRPDSDRGHAGVRCGPQRAVVDEHLAPDCKIGFQSQPPRMVFWRAGGFSQMPCIRITIRFDSETLRLVDREARRQKASRSEFIRNAVRHQARNQAAPFAESVKKLDKRQKARSSKPPRSPLWRLASRGDPPGLSIRAKGMGATTRRCASSQVH